MSAGRRAATRRELEPEYAAPASPCWVKVPPARYLAIDGRGRPGGPGFEQELSALYGAAFTLKFAEKARGRDFRVHPLEGLYWGGLGDVRKGRTARSMRWRLLIRMPESVRPAAARAAVASLRERRPSPALEHVGLVRESEGLCVQLLHVGPYSTEDRSVSRMAEFARSAGYALSGPHHEIYLSNPGRNAPSRIRTILRHPVHRSG